VPRKFRSFIVCYHAASAGWDHDLSLAPPEIERHVAFLLRSGFRPGSVADALAGRRVLHVTFDDAFRSVVDVLPELERLRVPVTMFACSDFARDGRPLDVPELALDARAEPEKLATMNWDALRALAERGVEIGSHTVSHPHLTRLTDAELARELQDSRERVAAELGRCRYLAYPYGEYDSRVSAAAAAAGYEAAFALAAPERPDVEIYAIPRVGIYRSDGIARVALKAIRPARRAAAALRRNTHA
jgi:peptidoglycan/xylan/chitin deacetylase (PgdA/CDA1 family)